MLKTKLVALWAQAQEKGRPLYAEVKERGLNGLRTVIRQQGPVLWAKVKEEAKIGWQWVMVKVKAVPVPKQAMVHIAVGLAAVSLWLVLKTIPGVMAAALATALITAFFALIVAFMAYGGVAMVIPMLKPAEHCAD
jgi:hypothetical protein